MNVRHTPLITLSKKPPISQEKIKRARKTTHTTALNFTAPILMARPPAKEVQVERSSAISFSKIHPGLQGC